MAVRLALQPIVLREANARLMALEAYDGHVDDIDLALWRGAYRIDGIRIVKTGAGQPTPFFSGDRIELLGRMAQPAARLAGGRRRRSCAAT